MSKNVKQSSPKTAALAGATLRDKKASKEERTLAASALAQSGTQRETGKKMEGLASRALASAKTSPRAKTLAASVTAQANKKR